MTTHTMDPMVFDNMEDLTDAADSWSGDYDNDSVKGMGGDDTLTGDAGAGQDTDGASHDFINGNKGDDNVNGGQGNDTLRGGMDDDMVDGGAGNDMVYGDKGNDTLMGGAGKDMMHGGEGHDSIVGGGGNDTMRGGMGHDRLEGGAGHDMVYGDKGDDYIMGGGGHDMLFGGEGKDLIMADGGDDSANGNQGMDTIHGGDGNDTLRGGRDNDMIDGDAGDDMIYGDKGKDILDGGGGADTVYGDNMMSSPDHTGDMIIGGVEENWSEITDKLALVEGAPGGTIVYGDKLYGGAGNDTIHGGNVGNTDGASTESVTFEYPSGGQTANFMFIHGNMLDGGAGDDMLIGAGGQDTLDGGAGDDNLVGGAGKDMLMGGTGNDTLMDAGADADPMSGGNKLMGGAGNDELSSTHQLLVNGAGGATALVGGAVDVLDGGAGDDLLKVTGVANIGNDLTASDADFVIEGDDKLTSGLVMIGGSGSDTFDFTGVESAITNNNTVIEIKDFRIGSDKIKVNDAVADDDVALVLQEIGSPSEFVASTAGHHYEVGKDLLIAIGDNVVLKLVAISDEELGDGSQIFIA